MLPRRGCSGWNPRPPRYRAAPGKRWASQRGDQDAASGLAAPDGGGLTGDPCIQPGKELRPLLAPFAGPDGRARPWVHQPRQDKARGRTKPGSKAAEPDGTFPGGKGLGVAASGQGVWWARPMRPPPAWSPAKFATGTWAGGQGAAPESPSCCPGSICGRLSLLSGGRGRSCRQREDGEGGPSILW